MKDCLKKLLRQSVIIGAVVVVTLIFASRDLAAYGGGDGGGGGGGGDDGTATVTISVWDIPFGLPDEAGTSGGTLELATPLENKMEAAWRNLGGQAGTGKTFDQWRNTREANTVLNQGLQDQAHSEMRRANVAVVALEVLDGAGQASQFVLSWVPGVGTGTGIGLDVGRTFADRFKKATEQGYSYADAVAAGMQDATLKGATSLISSLTFGRLADHHTNQIQNLSDMSYQSVDTAIYHAFGYMGTKTLEQTVTYGVDSVRDQVMDRAPRNSSRSVSSLPVASPGSFGITQQSR